MRLSNDKLVKFLLPMLLGLPIVHHSFPYFQRNARTPMQQSLGNGIQYKRVIWQEPRPNVLHVATIDLTQPNLGVLVSPGSPSEDKTVINAMTTSEFLKKHNLQLAVNASFFYKFQEDAPWAYYPKSGNRVNVVGEAISNGQIYSKADPKSDWAMVCFDRQNHVQIIPKNSCPTGTQQAVSGNEMLMMDGQPMDQSKAMDRDKPYSRVVFAQNKAGTKLLIVVVDGKQLGYGEGVKLAELIPFLQELGADRAINLDGGGSTTMVMAKLEGPQVLNAPIQNKIPMNERPVANHVGFFIKN
jgi:exopolysaccharide biosynthesis protein